MRTATGSLTASLVARLSPMAARSPFTLGSCRGRPSTAEDHGRLEHDDAADAQQARKDADQDHGRRGDRQQEPRREEGKLPPLREYAEQAREADPHPVAEQADD